MADVHKCMAILKHCEERWHTSRRLLEILCDLAAADDLPLLQPSPTGGTKRVRDSESPPSIEDSGSTSPEGPRTIAGSRRIPQDVQSQSQSQSQSQPQSRQSRQSQHVSPPFNLPSYSNELGRLALHGQVHLSTSGFTPTTTTASTPRQVDSTSMWYSSLSTETHHSPGGLLSASGPSHMHDYAHPSVSFMYPTDELYHCQMTSSYGWGFASQHRSPDTTQFSGPGPGGAAGGSGTERHRVTHYIQAPIDASVRGQPPLIAAQTQTQARTGWYGHGHGHGHGAVNPDPGTIAMLSTAPTGFLPNDWGSFITNVSVTANPDESDQLLNHDMGPAPAYTTQNPRQSLNFGTYYASI
ncbi:hypothetical protein BDN67DRAFT_1004404 [Paxillus ammoniavirescens]|nr:hypothetical protein BDN67DRAFT_1004404 [Paxillus ammoniavirescens]